MLWNGSAIRRVRVNHSAEKSKPTNAKPRRFEGRGCDLKIGRLTTPISQNPGRQSRKKIAFS